MATRVDVPTLKVNTPTGSTPSGRGFYQLEEDSLYVQVGEVSEERHFFSYLEADNVRFDIDQHGRLMLIEVDLPRRRWKTNGLIAPAKLVQPADIRWLDFRAELANPEVVTNERRTAVGLNFSKGDSFNWYELGDQVHARIDSAGRLLSVIVSDIIDDLAGREIAAFRKKTRSHL